MTPFVKHKHLRLGFSLLGSAAGMLLLTIGTAVANDHDYGRTVIFDSRAVDQASGETLYTERHVYKERDGKPVEAKVTYMAPDGSVWATKELTFQNGATAPFFHRRNLKTGYQEGFVAIDDAGEKGMLFHRAEGEEQGCGDAFAVKADYVVDAGFNQHLQSQLAALETGKKLRFDLLIPKACRTIEFEARSRASDKSDVLVISMRPTNMFARLVVPETQVRYNRLTGALLGYTGISDLTDDQGRTMKVDIEFEPPKIVTAKSSVDSKQAGRFGLNEQGNKQE